MMPLQTLIRTGKKDLQRSGELRDILITGKNPFPEIRSGNVAPYAISGQESSSTKLEIGLNILDNIIGALGGAQSSLNTGYTNAKSLVFSFENVFEDHADINLLDQFLTTALIKPDQKSVTSALIDDKVYVINSTLKTKTFTVRAITDKGASANLDIPLIQEAASGSLEIDVTNAYKGVVSYQGDVPVVFGFQAVQLIYNDETRVYTAIGFLKSGKDAAKSAGIMGPKVLTLTEGVFFRVHG